MLGLNRGYRMGNDVISRQQSAGTRGSKRIPQLEGLRFIMCCIIVLSHFEFLCQSEIFGEFYDTYLSDATFAVDYFFMLSGFGIFLSKKRPERSIKSAFYFAADKVKKIYPAYIISLVLGAIWEILFTKGLMKAIAKIIIFIPLDLSLFQSLAGIKRVSHSMNGVCWFLSTLFICYIFCPWFLHFADKLKNKSHGLCRICFLAFVILALSSGALFIERSLPGVFDDLWYGHPFIRCWYLAIGMCIGYLYRENKSTFGTGGELAAAIITASYFFGRSTIPCGKEILRVFDLLLCIVFLYVFSCGNGRITKFLSSKFVVKFGNISMYLFLFHYPVRRFLVALFTIADIHSTWGYLIEVILIILITCLITYRYCRFQRKSRNCD